jgi:hypothetical protein
MPATNGASDWLDEKKEDGGRGGDDEDYDVDDSDRDKPGRLLTLKRRTAARPCLSTASAER